MATWQYSLQELLLDHHLEAEAEEKSPGKCGGEGLSPDQTPAAADPNPVTDTPGDGGLGGQVLSRTTAECVEQGRMDNQDRGQGPT